MNDYLEQKREDIYSEKKRIETEFKLKALKKYSVFDTDLSPYEMAEFIAFIVGKKREETAKMFDMDLFDIRYIYSKIGLTNRRNTSSLLVKVRRAGYKSIFHFLSENYDLVGESSDEVNTTKKTISSYANKCIDILRRVWHGYSKNKVKKLRVGDVDGY
jgi:hypothetical protein